MAAEEQGSSNKLTLNPTRVVRNGKSPLSGKPKKPKSPTPVSGSQMTFFEHLGELRSRLVWSSLAIAVLTGIAWFFHEDIAGAFFALANEPIRELVAQGKPKPEFVNLNLVSGFSIYFEVSLYAGLLLSSPVIVYHVLAFMAPALEPETRPGDIGHEEEVKMLKAIRGSLIGFIPLVALFFLAGVAFAYYLILPQAVKFLLGFGADQFRATLDVKPYIGTVGKIMFWTGLVFEMPVILFLMAKLQIVTWKKLASYWKIALVVSMVLAAFITPSPDIVSQAVISVPVFGLFWLGVLFARFA